MKTITYTLTMQVPDNFGEMGRDILHTQLELAVGKALAEVRGEYKHFHPDVLPEQELQAESRFEPEL